LFKKIKQIYVATARNWDDDFQKRIDRHQNNRDDRWVTIEKEKYISKIDFTNKVAIKEYQYNYCYQCKMLLKIRLITVQS
jgi:adenosyl cobinamide kinase/adenosyl cobinamide phosphate guanylyltransferase